MSAQYETLEGVGLVRITGSLLVTDAGALRESFNQWYPQAQCSNVVVDLSGLEQLDSAGLGALVAAAQRVRDNGGDLRFAALGKRIRMVFEITRSYKVFDIFDTVEEALRASR